MPTTAALASVTTGTTIKTMLQLATPATRMIQLIEWGYSLDDPPGADAVFELIQTDVAATVTAHVAAGVIPLDPNQPPSLLTLGVAATGYTSTAEGAIAATRVLDAKSLSSVSGESPLDYFKQWVPDQRPFVAISKFLRVRATTPSAAVDMRCYVVWDE
jgi:hypothetical protein